MASKLAIFDFVNEDNVLDIGDTKQILNVADRHALNNTDWDFQAECRVRWQTKAKVTISAAKIIWFGDDRKALTEILDGLIEGHALEDCIRNQDSLGRGKRQAKKPVVSSDDETEVPTKQMPARKQKIRTSEKKSDQDLLATLKEKAKCQVKPVSSTKEVGTIEELRKEIATLKETVATLKESNASLQSAIQTMEENNITMASTVASLSNLPSIVDKLVSLLGVQSPNQPAPNLREEFLAVTETRPITRPNPRQAPHPIVAEHQQFQLDLRQTPPPIENADQPTDPSGNIPAPEEEVTTLGADVDSAVFMISTSIVNRAKKKTDARKMTNDLLHGLYSEEFLAGHSVTGGGGVRSQNKPGMAEHEVNAITSAVISHFPSKTVTEVKFYMREKLNNAAKVLRRKQTKKDNPPAPDSAILAC